MINEDNQKYEHIKELRRQGKTTTEIMKMTGLSRTAINIIVQQTAVVSEKAIGTDYANTKMTPDQKFRWVKYVNRIRAYYGKAPFPLPEVEDEQRAEKKS